MRGEHPQCHAIRLVRVDHDISPDRPRQLLKQRRTLYGMEPELGLGQMQWPSLAGSSLALAACSLHRGAEGGHATSELFRRAR